MDFKENLENLKNKIDKQIELYLDEAIKEKLSQDRFVADSLKMVKNNILSGGKRIRPALMCWGYLGAGGRREKDILKTSVGIELIHAFLLIHDDIMDRDFKRHGKPTVNAEYRDFCQKRISNTDSEHFGNSMAIIVGDMVGALGNQIIFSSNFDPKKIMEALIKLQDIVSLTVVGQAKDIYMEYFGGVSEKDVLEMYEYKTARYTMEGPLHLGGILGGADKEILDSYSRFSIPLGIAFQIQDDILGVFGTEKIIGKTVGSDISEGKQTILVVKALEMANQEQKRKIKNILGKKELSKQEIEDFKEVLIDCGSFDYAVKLSQRLIEEGKLEIEKAEISDQSKEFFLGLADYLIKRDF